MKYTEMWHTIQKLKLFNARTVEMEFGGLSNYQILKEEVQDQ